MHKSFLYAIGLAVSVCIVGFTVRLAAVQSAAGTAYPAYSSLRADAVGLKAMFDVVELVGRKAVRGYLPASESGIQDATVIRLALSAGDLMKAAIPGPDNAAMLAAAGNTVVLGLAGDCHYAIIKEWQLTLQCGDDGQYLSGPGWTALGSDDQQHPQVVERKFGAGEIVLVANSRVLNNGALARRSHAVLVAMLVERRPTVWFDEEHLGVVDSSSIGKLLRHYRLHGVMLAGLLLFALFVWKSASSFLPRVELPQNEIVGRDVTAGLSNVLRRSVPVSRLLSVAIAEWAKSGKGQSREHEIREIAAQHNDPAAAYNAVATALQSKRTYV